MFDDLGEWEKTVGQFELCQGVLTEADRRTILHRKLPTSISSSLLSNLRNIPTYVDMKAEIELEIVFIRDYGSGSAAGHAHVVDEQVPPEEEEQGFRAEDAEEGILSGMSPEQSEPIRLAARQAGFKVRAPFRRTSSGNKFQPKLKFQPKPRVPTPPRTGEREAKCGNCGGAHATRDCPNSLLEDSRRKCFNCGEEGHRAKYCKKPDRRKQQHGGKIVLVGAPASTFWEL